MKRLVTVIIMVLFSNLLIGQDIMFEDPNSWTSFFKQNLRSLLWAITAAIGFGLGVGISLKVFDWLSSDIDEWEEIKKGNLGVSLIFVSLIVMVGLIVYKVI